MCVQVCVSPCNQMGFKIGKKKSSNLDTFTQLQLFNPHNKAAVENLGGGHSTMAGGKPQGPAATSKVPSASEHGGRDHDGAALGPSVLHGMGMGIC